MPSGLAGITCRWRFAPYDVTTRALTHTDTAKLPSADSIERLIRAIDTTDIETISLRWGDVRVRVSQSPERFTPAAGEPPAATGPIGVAITAPLTGVYYGRPAPDQPNFVDLGAIVTRGQVVGLIETMKLFNEIVSEIEGEVSQILVSEGDLVESGQPLIHVSPSSEEKA